MAPKAERARTHQGFTLIGTLIAVVVLLIALIGTSTFRYTAALDGRRAAAQTTGAGVAILLCEGWRGLKGDENHDPTQFTTGDMEITQSSWDGHVTPDNYTLLGNYEVVMDSQDQDSRKYYATLSWRDVQPGLRALTVNVAWPQRIESAENAGNVDKSYVLTIYTRTN
jgi:Tfp pilus assembly protein PilV